MVGRDLKEDVVFSETEAVPTKLTKMLRKFSEGFHRFGLWFTMFTLLGLYIGITVSKTYYASKMSEAIKVGGFLFQDKVYTVIAK